MGTKERKEREKHLRRHTIINAAERIFFIHGIEKATMSQVAREAELSKGTLYLYFKSKDELYRAILLRGYEILKKEIDAAISETQNGYESVRQGLKALMEFAFRHPGYFAALLYYENDTFDLDQLEPESEQCLEAGKELLYMLAGALEKGRTDGSIRKDIEPLKDALLLWAQLTGLLHMIKRRNDLISRLYKVEKEALCQKFFQMLDFSIKNSEVKWLEG
jgi:TetR/AcrR family transcriptional regulator